MSTTDDLLRANEAYAATYTEIALPMPPDRHVAVVACMDSRLDVYRILGLALGQAHVIRNAGSPTSRPTSASPWPASTPAPLSRTRTCAGSFSTSPRASSTK